jgi:hypothetical protein
MKFDNEYVVLCIKDKEPLTLKTQDGEAAGGVLGLD